MRCFPFILLNHASASAKSWSGTNCSACASNGASETEPSAAAPAASLPKKSRREAELKLLVCIYSQILVIEKRRHGIWINSHSWSRYNVLRTSLVLCCNEFPG